MEKIRWGRYNPLPDLRRGWDLGVRKKPIRDLTPYEKRFRSQHGEDGILHALFSFLGAPHRYFVEFGAGDGRENNTRHLSELGWTGLRMDGGHESEALGVRREFIDAGNINDLFRKYGVPDDFDLLSIDIDGNDYWVWKALDHRYRPRVVVMEYNANIPPEESRTVPYDPNFRWDGSDFFGASLLALKNLGARKGYVLVGCDSSGTNAFFVQEPLVEGCFIRREAGDLYRPPVYRGRRQNHPHDPQRTMILV